MESISFRKEVRKSDVETVREMVTGTGFFNREEIDIAAELVMERLEKGEASGYEFIFLELDETTVAYSCFGRIPLTKSSYDLYWIVTNTQWRNRGLGKILLKETEEAILKENGSAVYAETSSREQYLPTRKFYENNGYLLKARFEDYYDRGDDLVFYVKGLA
ncbi:MAG: GNAT family N-acetyltransferase [Bacteroidetes bacterium]|nr:GNAT family N-acetyltransferase [Bacteroidota bacterium]